MPHPIVGTVESTGDDVIPVVSGGKVTNDVLTIDCVGVHTRRCLPHGEITKSMKHRVRVGLEDGKDSAVVD